MTPGKIVGASPAAHQDPLHRNRAPAGQIPADSPGFSLRPHFGQNLAVLFVLRAAKRVGVDRSDGEWRSVRPTGVRRPGIVIGLAAMAIAAGSGVAGAAQCGKAAWFDLDGLTASGERADSGDLTAAHRSLPFQTRVRVENLANGRSVVVRVNDRGPFTKGRVIDVSKAAAAKIGMIQSGIARVRVTVVSGKGSLPDTCGSDVPAAKPSIVEASLEADLPPPPPRPKPQGDATADVGPAAAPEVPVPDAPAVDQDIVVLTPDSVDALPDRFADAFAPQKAELALVKPLLEKAGTETIVPPIDPHHGVAPREDWDVLQQTPD